jgi:hypothetical protein
MLCTETHQRVELAPPAILAVSARAYGDPDAQPTYAPVAIGLAWRLRLLVLSVATALGIRLVQQDRMTTPALAMVLVAFASLGVQLFSMVYPYNLALPVATIVATVLHQPRATGRVKTSPNRVLHCAPPPPGVQRHVGSGEHIPAVRRAISVVHQPGPTLEVRRQPMLRLQAPLPKRYTTAAPHQLHRWIAPEKATLGEQAFILENKRL